MQPELTHEEACKLVEDAIANSLQTLFYIRKKLDKKSMGALGRHWPYFKYPEHANLLCNINYYGAFLAGAKSMARAMVEWDLLDFPAKKNGKGRRQNTMKRANPIVNKAIFDLFISSTRNLEYCLYGLPDNVEIYTQHELDKKGKIIGAQAKFVKKETKYKEI